MKLVELPNNFSDIPKSLRALADRVEEGIYGEVHHLAWVIDADYKQVEMGLLGKCANPDAVFVLLIEAGKANLLGRMGK